MKKFFLLIFILLNLNFLNADILKVTLVEKITQFIKWPNLENTFVIGIYKNKDLQKEMIKVYKDKQIHKLPIKVINILDSNDIRIKDINLLYFTKESSVEVDSIIKQVKTFPVLTITEFPNDVYDSIHFGFYYKNQRIKFLINQKLLEESKLKASYKILQLSKIVKKDKQ